MEPITVINIVAFIVIYLIGCCIAAWILGRKAHGAMSPLYALIWPVTVLIVLVIIIYEMSYRDRFG